MMAMFFAQRVILGKTTFANVPKALKAGVAEVLIDSGLPELVPTEYGGTEAERGPRPPRTAGPKPVTRRKAWNGPQERGPKAPSREHVPKGQRSGEAHNSLKGRGGPNWGASSLAPFSFFREEGNQ